MTNKKLTDRERNAIDECVQMMHLPRIVTAMQALDWRWFFGKDAEGHDIERVPTEEELESELRRLCAEAIAAKTGISTGGFSAYYNDGKTLSVDFCLEYWETEVKALGVEVAG
jgi:hypothetical protein